VAVFDTKMILKKCEEYKKHKFLQGNETKNQGKTEHRNSKK
jgi:hypothetical protein